MIAAISAAIMAATLANPAKYLDCHVHTAGIGAGGSGCFISKTLRDSYKFGIYLKSFGVTEKLLEQQGDGLVLQKISASLAQSETVGTAVVLALDGVIDDRGELDSARTQVYIPGAFLAREIPKYPNLLYGASINPKRKDALARLAQAKADGAVLVKWIPSIMDFDPSDSAFIPFYKALKETGMPLLTHTGTESSFIDARDSLCDPLRLELPLSLGVTVIAAHVGTPGKSHGEENVERALRLLGRYPDLYADVSSLTQINKLTLLKKILARPEAQGKLIYGTDYPLINTALVSPYYFFFQAPYKNLRAVGAIANAWDRDVALKKALGVPEDVLARSAALLRPGSAR